MSKVYRKSVLWKYKSVLRSVLKYFNNDTSYSWSSIKSDAINTLRKKYEAFLEQDRKRKERNDYILGILDKMRSCTAVVQHKSTPFAPVSRKSFVPPKETLPGALYSRGPRDLAMNVPSRNAAEHSFLTDLLSKYILIPKRNHNYEENPYYDRPIELANQENTDWKNKYEILNLLKQKEKEGVDPQTYGNLENKINKPTNEPKQQPTDYVDDLPEKDIPDNKIRDKGKLEVKKQSVVPNARKVDKSDQSIGNKQLYHTVTNLGDTQDLPSTEPITEHDVPVESRVEYNLEDHSELLEYEYKPSHTTSYEENPKVEYSAENSADSTIIPQSHIREVISEDVQYRLDVLNVEHFTPNNDVILNEGVNINPPGYGLDQSHFSQFSETAVNQQSIAEQQQYNTELQHEYNNEQQPQQYNEEQQYNTAQQQHQYNEEHQQYNTEQQQHQYNEEQQPQQYNEEQQQYNTEQQLQYNTGQPQYSEEQQQQYNEQQQLQYSNEQDKPQYDTAGEQHENILTTDINQQINDETTGQAAAEHVDVPSNPTVDELEEEQKIFYQEHVEGDVTYSEEGANMYENQNEYYQQNAQYYETPQDQAFPTEINEHEETNQEYDPSYAQQYLNTQGDEYGQQAQLDQQYAHQQGLEPATVAYDQQQYEQTQVYEQYNQGYYDQQQYQQDNYETVQQVEQQLDNEENYSVEQNAETDRLQVVEDAVNQDQPEQAQEDALSTMRAN